MKSRIKLLLLKAEIKFANYLKNQSITIYYIYNRFLIKLLEKIFDVFPYDLLILENIITRNQKILILGNSIDLKQLFIFKQISILKYIDWKFYSNKNSNKQNFNVAVIVSIYKSEKYLDYFIKNIEQQTIFNDLEVYIGLINPSPYEFKKLKEFEKQYKNIFVDIIESPYIPTIYEIWNKGISATKANLITNWNVDDIRSLNSLEIQRDQFNNDCYFDVLYQDVFFLHTYKRTFSKINKGVPIIKTPSVNYWNLVIEGWNSPHNAPMWRRTLHEEIGLFDASMISAGDYDFWVKCLLNDKIFYKDEINPIHVGYFFNEFGISTRKNSISFAEEKLVQKKALRHLEVLYNIRIQPNKDLMANYQRYYYDLLLEKRDWRNN